MGSRKVNLYINDVPVELDYFVQGFIDHVIDGIITSLKGTSPIKNLNLFIQNDTVTIDLNNTVIPINPFVNTTVKNTIIGMVSSLKGVTEVSKLQIVIAR